jgi:glycosyltransferase involved in cell wall biosynthesis
MKKKKILLLSDDLRLPSGIGSVSRELVVGTADQFDWVQVGAAINHPDAGKILDISDSIKKDFGYEDCNVRIYPNSGYGDPNLIRHLMETEKPDAIVHFTDPRFWIWLYQMEHEIRQNIPLLYLNIWDDLPDPHYNRTFYASCDALFAISKQTYGINKRVLNKYLGEGSLQPWQLKYIPHGINEKFFKPVPDSDADLQKLRKRFFGDKQYEYVVFFNSRNIRRKQLGDVIMAFKWFWDKLTPDQQAKTALLMHTDAVDENGTDLPVLLRDLAPELNVVITNTRLSVIEMNLLYNIADVTVNISSNEGFGLSGAESIMAGTPIIVNVTGGLQDHCGFTLSDSVITAEQYEQIGSLHDPDQWETRTDLDWGDWCTPVWPACSSLQGSVPTPYIYDDRVNYKHVGRAIWEWWDMTREQRKAMGAKGREYALNPESGLSASNMSNRLKSALQEVFDNWQPKKRFELIQL